MLALASWRREAIFCRMTCPRFPLISFTIALLTVPAVLAAQNPNAKTVAQAMAGALRRNAATEPISALATKLEAPEDQFTGVFFKKMMAAASENVTGMPAAQLFFAIRGYYVTRRPVSDTQRADYLARLDRINNGVIGEFNPSSSSNTGVRSLVAGDPSMAPWSLLAVDSLFQDGKFQLQVFHEALPLAKEALKSNR